jgi:hypothetical protein
MAKSKLLVARVFFLSYVFISSHQFFFVDKVVAWQLMESTAVGVVLGMACHANGICFRSLMQL